MEKIIQKAIEGEYLLLSIPYEKVEYKNKWLLCTLKKEYIKAQKTEQQEIAIASILIDPLFWKAIGKACGWVQGIEKEIAMQFFHRVLIQSFEEATKWLEDLVTN